MPTYSRYGNLDDRILKDGDVGFVGFNNRLRPDQLQSGVLADAQNIRLDRNGEAQVRKGIDLFLAPLSVGADALTLPFYLVADDNTVTVTQTSGDLIITNVDAANFPDSGTINLSGVTGITPDPNGNRPFTKDSSTQITISDQTYSGTAGGTAIVKFGILADDSVNAIYGSTGFSDPAEDASQYIIIASNSKAIAIKMSDGTTTDIAYPSGVLVSQSVDMIQAFNKVFIFRDGKTALEWDGSFSGSPAFTKVESGEYTQPVQIVCASGEFALIENRGIVHQEDGVSIGSTITVVGDKTLDSDQTSGLTIGAEFTVAKIFEGGSTTSITAASASLVSGGEFDGLYKVTATAAGHGKSVGDPVDIAGFGDTKIDGSRFVAEVDGDDFVFYVPQNPSTTISGDETVALAPGFEFFIDPAKTDTHITDGDSLTATPVFSRKVSVGLGFTHMPAPPFAIYHQRRLVMPYNYTVDTADDSFTSRDILDEVIASDILDSDTYDQIYGSYRFNAGTADFIVGLHSFSDDTLMVFNRNSIHVVKNSIDLTQSLIQLLTDEVGCLARKSIQQVGNRILFLSDNGVYGTEFLDEYNLRGTQTPLSEPINETIKRINKAQASKAVSAYFDNRYYLAVPLDDATENDTILIYNFLNQQWESVDSVGDSNFHTTNLLVVGEGNDRGIYATNDIGGIHRLDARDDDVDRVITQVGGSQKNLGIPASITTRQFTYGSLERKKFKEFEIHTQSSETNDSDFDILLEVENPDFGPEKINDLRELNGGTNLPSSEDVSVRGRIGNRRGYGAQFTINNTTGRPRIRAIQASASDTFNSTKKAI